MKCFIHNNVEAVAACRKCGKGMCANCSSYSGHTGICPECRKEEFIKEVWQKNNELSNLKTEMGWGIFWTVILCWTVVGLLVGLWNYFKRKKHKDALEERIKVLNNEITKLDEILTKRGGPAFV